MDTSAGMLSISERSISMATPQPQPAGQQPIYANELNNALDRQYTKLVNYTDARIDALVTQMRVYREESLARDNELRDGMRALADAILKVGQRISNLETRVTNIETTQTVIIDTPTAMRHEIQEGFTAQREQTNELTTHVMKLEGGLPPTSE
jgi:hypothetical protein